MPDIILRFKQVPKIAKTISSQSVDDRGLNIALMKSRSWNILFQTRYRSIAPCHYLPWQDNTYHC